MLNLFGQCRKYGLPFWQCPQFLFLAMGLVIAVSTISIYTIGARFIDDPRLVAVVVLFVAAVLFAIASVITQSFERLAEVSRLKSEFVSVVSHQLRSPLTNLKWATDFLMSGRSGQVSEKQAEYFRVLKENSGRMEELVSDLLTVSRLETAKMVFNKTSFYLTDLLKEIAFEFKPFADASNIGIKLNIASDLPEILADRFQVKQVFANILDNAIRYVKEKGLVEITSYKKNSGIYLEVKDNGVGIPREDQKYIFQKFFRSANALRHQTQGSGLGLYIAKSLIEKMGGKIGFFSQEGEGSTFWIILPIK